MHPANGAENSQETREVTRDVCHGTLALLPSWAGANFLRNKLLPDARFQQFYQHFTRQGFKFVPERVQVAVGVGVGEPGEENRGPALPFLLAVVPSFRTFEQEASSHDAVSIGVLRERQVNTVLAGTVTVGHRPYQIVSFGVVEMNAAGQLVPRSIDRKTLEQTSPEELARCIGLPAAPTEHVDAEVAGPSVLDSVAFAATLYRTLLNDDYARPLYPPEGLRSLMADTSLVQKWLRVNAERYGLLMRSIPACCTTCSCNACSSTCSCCFEISL